MNDHNITSLIEGLAGEPRIFSANRALEFWQNSGSPEFLKMVIYLTGLKVDWLLQFQGNEDKPPQKDFFDVARGVGLTSRTMAICTGIEPHEVTKLLEQHRLRKKMIDEIVDHIIQVRTTAILMIRSQEFLYYKQAHPMQIPGDPNGTIQ